VREIEGFKMNLNRLDLITECEKDGLITRKEAIDLTNKFVCNQEANRKGVV
jgi:hypothetical protein